MNRRSSSVWQGIGVLASAVFVLLLLGAMFWTSRMLWLDHQNTLVVNDAFDQVGVLRMGHGHIQHQTSLTGRCEQVHRQSDGSWKILASIRSEERELWDEIVFRQMSLELDGQSLDCQASAAPGRFKSPIDVVITTPPLTPRSRQGRMKFGIALQRDREFLTEHHGGFGSFEVELPESETAPKRDALEGAP